MVTARCLCCPKGSSPWPLGPWIHPARDLQGPDSFLLSIARVSPEVAREQPSASPEGKPNEQVLFVANWVDSLLNLGA